MKRFEIPRPLRPRPAAVSVLAVLVAGPAPATAQAGSAATLPAGLLATPGASSTSFPFRGAATRYQEIHTTLRGAPIPGIRSLAFRRDERTSAVPSAVARTAVVEVLMGHGSVAAFGSRFDDNFAAPPTVVFAAKTVNLPDWTAHSGAAAGTPEPWDVVLPFDRTFAYDGSRDLVWELRYDQASQTGTFRADRSARSPEPLYTATSGQNLVGGCPPFTLSATLYSHYGAQRMRLRTSVRQAPAGAPVFLNLGLADPMLSLPGICATVRSDAAGVLPLGVASGSGNVGNEYRTYPFTQALLVQPLHLQAWALDANVPGGVVASDGLALTLPIPPAAEPQHAYLISSDLAAVSGEGPFHTGAVVSRVEW